MANPPPPLWNMPSPGSPPGAAMPPSAKRVETFATVCLALSALELVYCVQRLLSPIFTRSVLSWQKALTPKTRGGPPMDEIMAAAQRFAQSIAIWESARAVPFLIATCALGWIALRLRKGETAALFAARRWTFAALGVVAISTLIQVLVTVPATMEYQKSLVGMMPVMKRGAAPFDVGALMSSVTLAATVIGLIVGAITFSAWPIAVYVWSGKLIRETSAAREPSGEG